MRNDRERLKADDGKGGSLKTYATNPRPFLTAEWRYLAMVNYAIDADILAPYVPAGTELDTWDGRTFASLVGFLFLDTRLMGVAIPYHRDFEEVNLRFYVRRKAPDGWRRGVVFVKEIVPRWAIAAVARGYYGEKYVALPMRHRIELEGEAPRQAGAIEYGWRLGSEWNRVCAQISGEARLVSPGSEAEFITEHYWGYASRRGGTVEYQVEHPSWLVWPASRVEVDCNVPALYGRQFAAALGAEPTSAFVALGSAVTVYRGRRIEGIEAP